MKKPVDKPKKRKLIGYNYKVCRGKNFPESGNMVAHICEGFAIPVFEKRKDLQMNFHQEKCESCLAGFSREDALGHCTCNSHQNEIREDTILMEEKSGAPGKEPVTEHCCGPKCPECNQKAYEAGYTDGTLRALEHLRVHIMMTTGTAAIKELTIVQAGIADTELYIAAVPSPIEDYETNHSHGHCWESENPPCGLRGKHRCCLCAKEVPCK